MYNYVVTAHKPSRVSHTAVGNFLGPNQRNLLVAKVNHIQIYTITPHGLESAFELPIYGTIFAMILVRMPNDLQHHLVLHTEKYQLAILRWDASASRCKVISSGNTMDHFNSNASVERIVVADPLARCIAIHQYARLLKLVPTSVESDAFNVRLLEEQVHDMVFLYGKTNPTIAVLHSKGKDSNEMRTYEVNMAEQDLSDGLWKKADLDISCCKMVAVPEPYCGLLIFGDDSITYLSPSGDHVSQPIDATIINSVGAVDTDGRRYLIGDHKGQLMMLVLETDVTLGVVLRLKIETLGETSSACSISYLDTGFVYVGSMTGDSQLIRLSTSKTETGSFLEVVQTYPHLGPILDFCIVKGMGYLRQGQGQVVTCSGVGKDGSLRIIRNGIGITEQAASVDLPGIKDMYSLRRHFGDRYHSYLLQSFTSETRILELIGAEEMAPATLPGFDETTPTLHAANMFGDILVQVTANGVQVFDCETRTAAPTLAWTPPTHVRISVASGNDSQLLIATTGGNLIYLNTDPEKKTLVEVSHSKMENEISCVNCNTLKVGTQMTDIEQPVDSSKALVAVVGLWAEVNESPVVKLVALPSLKTIQTVELGGDVIARCVLLATLESYNYLLVALGDGCLLTYSFNAEAAAAAAEKSESPSALSGAGEIVSERRRLSVGTQPAQLSIFKSRGADHIFAACDRPTVVYAATGGGKLLISNVNLQEVTRVCGFDTEFFPDCLAIATESTLHLGAVDEIQKLHITSVPLNEQPRRISHVESANVFAVLTASTIVDEEGDEVLEQFVRIIDDARYDTLTKFKLKPEESGSAILATTFSGEGMNKDEQYVVVGTAFERPNEDDPSDGRILILRIVDGRAIIVAELEVKGAVYSLCAFNGMLLASIGAEVLLVSVSEKKDGVLSIKEEDRHHGHILCYRIVLRGDFILVGDIFRSITVLTCKKIGDKIRLEEVARDYEVTWVMAIEMLDDDVYIVAEHRKHLCTYKRNSYAPTDAERGRLERCGQFHLGNSVNRIHHGSLVMQMPENEGPALKTLIFGTSDGMLGVIANLKKESFQFFEALQNAMATLVPGVGGFAHSEWREMVLENQDHRAPAKNYLDGDLIERFLDLSLAQMSTVSSLVNVSVEELVQRVEEMQRLHGAG